MSFVYKKFFLTLLISNERVEKNVLPKEKKFLFGKNKFFTLCTHPECNDPHTHNGSVYWLVIYFTG